MTMTLGPLIIVSGPSGCGKSTVVKRLLQSASRPLRVAVSATTRDMREGENEGTHYHFWTRERFERVLKEGGFLEHAEVHGNYYGTLRSEVDRYRQQGTGVILVIDVQGAAAVRELCPDAVSVFLKSPSPQVLEARLRGRGTESESDIRRRLAEAQREEGRSGEYAYQIINDRLDDTVAELRRIVERSF